MTAPCKNCKDRYLGCHDHCDKYKAFKEEIKKLRNSDSKEYEIRDYVRKAVLRNTKGR